MRDIKFRAWDEDNEHMTYSDNYHKEHETYAWGFEKGEFKVWVQFIHPATFDEPAYPDSDEISGPIMQYTGLLDKNGTEIYEGDVVEYSWLIEHGSHEVDNSGSGVVQFDDQVLEYNIKPFNTGEYPSLYLVSQQGESPGVIGNIHENPELMEGLK